MTCIVAIKHKGRIYLGADRKASWDFSQAQSMPRPKVQKREGILLAGTGDGALCHLIVDMMKFPIIEGKSDDYIHSEFFGRLTALLKSKGYTSKDNNLTIPHKISVEILVVCNGHLYTLDIRGDKDTHHGVIAIDEVGLPYATGCGGQLAWGALLALEKLPESRFLKPKDKLKIALKVAAEVSPGCNDQIDIVSEG